MGGGWASEGRVSRAGVQGSSQGAGCAVQQP